MWRTRDLENIEAGLADTMRMPSINTQSLFCRIIVSKTLAGNTFRRKIRMFTARRAWERRCSQKENYQL
jgi:hypothetical protein